ncbi:MAG: hypothetical protein LAT62_08495 [Natronospirillum sp.]|uniref:hypothetical protein n=1 Tax=Natronospirillum sp. TaxID=2812955 RepID=UPI0025E4BD88|nr:hypothetical protein [Natronospirillum sp.]MCH8551960.1 hypothetical protein [Natronospirillum sp.]
MQPIILGKNLLTDDEILAFAMSEDNYRMLTLERLQHHALTAALLTASSLIRLQRQAGRLPLPPVSGGSQADT